MLDAFVFTTIRTQKGAEKGVVVHVVADEDEMIWRAEPGAFLFAVQE